MQKRKKRIFLMVALTVIGAVLLSTSPQVLAASPKGVLKCAFHWGISNDWFDPAMPTLGQSALPCLMLVHDALVKSMPGELYSPCLAESWNISPDFKVYDFKLRKGVKFHNGDEMTAEDVVFSFQRYKRGTSAKLINDRIAKLEAVNPYLFRVTFKKPFVNFLEYFLCGTSTIGWVVPKKYIERVGEAEFKRNPIGCGPYKLMEFKPDAVLVFEAFDGFWRKVPHVKRLEIRIIREASTRFAMVKKGEVDMATLMQDVLYENVKKDPKLRLLAPFSPTRWVLHMTSQWDPKSPWSDPRVRKAASLAIDRKSVADVHMPGCGPIGGLALEGDPDGVQYPPDPYDPAQAKKLLAEAGYPKGFHGGTFYPFDGPYWPMGEQIANYWKNIGISVDTKLFDRPSWIAARRSGQMKGGIFNDPVENPTIWSRLEYLFGGVYCYGNYPDIVSSWDQLNKSVDPKVRKDLIMRIQNLIHDKTMYSYLTSTNSPAAFGPKVKGDPYKIKKPYPLWFMAPFEDIELND
jgi:peptide/nickel transport system substrate-binding protein